MMKNSFAFLSIPCCLLLLMLVYFLQSNKKAPVDPSAAEIKTFAAKEAVTLRMLAKSFRMEGKRDSALLYEGQALGLETAVGYINLKP